MKKFKGYGFTLCVTAFLLVGLVGCDDTQTTTTTTQEETTTYKVEFMDGNTVLHTEQVEEGDKVAEYTPNVDGKEFLGWYIEPTFVHEFDFNVAITKDTKIFGSFVTYQEDTRTWQIVGAGKSNLLRKSNWGAGNTEEHLLTKKDVANKNVFTITTDLYANDEFQFAINKSWHNQRGNGYLITTTDADGEECFSKPSSIYDTGAKKSNIKVLKDGNYTLTLTTYPAQDYYDEEAQGYDEANKEAFNFSDVDTITFVRNGDPVEALPESETNYYIKGNKITHWVDDYNAEKMFTVSEDDPTIHTLSIYIEAGDEYMFTSRVTSSDPSEQPAAGNVYIRYSNIKDEESLKLVTAGMTTGENPTPNGNIVSSKSGKHTFVYDEDTQELTVSVDETGKIVPVDVYLKGSMNGMNWENQEFTTDWKLTPVDGTYTYTITKELAAGDEFGFSTWVVGTTAENMEEGRLDFLNFARLQGAYATKDNEAVDRTELTEAQEGKVSSNIKCVKAGTYTFVYDHYSRSISYTIA